MTTGADTDQDRQPKPDRIKQYHKELRQRLDAALSASKAERQEQMPALGREFLAAVERGNPATVDVFLDEGMNVNYRDFDTGQTALHVAACANAREVVRLLIKTGKCDYLIRDKRGRLASDLAYTVADDPALARLLGNKERKQAAQQGVDLTHRRDSPS